MNGAQVFGHESSHTEESKSKYAIGDEITFLTGKDEETKIVRSISLQHDGYIYFAGDYGVREDNITSCNNVKHKRRAWPEK